MKKGDVVVINDGSWTRSIVDGKLIHESLNFRAEVGKKYIIIETGCSFPNTGSLYGLNNRPSFNNTVIQAIDSGKVVFIEEHFLKLVPPTHRIMIDVESDGCLVTGNYVEISDKLYKEIKRKTQ